MKNKIPSLWKNIHTAAVLEKHLLKKISLPGDKDFIKSLYSSDESGRMTLKDDLSSAEIKKISQLHRVLKKNSGFFQSGKLILFAVIFGFLLLFSLFFKDRLIEHIMERSLEMIFQAKTEITGLRSSLIKGSLSFSSLTIGDKDAPMSNLVETGPVRIDMMTSQLLRKKFVLEEASVTALSWGTPRTTSAALRSQNEKRLDPQKKTLEKALDTKALTDALMPDFDSPRMAQEYKEIIKEARKNWEERILALDESTEALKEDYYTLQKTDLSSVKNVTQAKELLDTASEVKENLQKAKTLIRETAADFQTDKERLSTMEADIQNAIKKDVDRALALTGRGGPSMLVNQAVEEILHQKLGKYAPLASSLLDKIRSPSKEKTVKKEAPAPLRQRRGWDILFPVSRYPSVLAEKILVDIKEEERRVTGEIKNISTHPAMWREPIDFSYSDKGGNYFFDILGVIDVRRNVPPLIRVNLNGDGFRFSIKEPSPSLPALKEAKIRYGATGSLSLVDRNSALGGEFLFTVMQLDMNIGEEGDDTEKVIYKILSDASPFTVTAQLKFLPGGETDIGLKTSLGQALQDAAKTMASEEIAEQKARLEEELKSRISPLLEENKTELNAFLGNESLFNEKRESILSSEQGLSSLMDDLKKKAAGSLLPFQL